MSQDSPYYAETVGSPPPPKSNKTLYWILGIVGGVGVLSVILCCGGVVWLGYMGIGMAGEQIKQQVQNEPEIQEHIGEIESVTMNIPKTGVEAQNKSDVIVFDIKGSKGTGDLIIEQGPGEGIGAARLRKPDGTIIEVLPNSDPIETSPNE